MDSNGNAVRNVEIVVISNEEITTTTTTTSSSTKRPPKIPIETLTHHHHPHPPPRSLDSPSPGRMNKYCPSPHRSFRSSSPASSTASPSNTNLRRRSVARSAFQKPKTRFAEPFAKINEENDQVMQHPPPHLSPDKKLFSTAEEDREVEVEVEGLKTHPSGFTDDLRPITPKTPLMASPGVEVEDEEVYKIASKMKKSRKKRNGFFSFEWIAFVCIMGFFLASLTVNKLQDLIVWKLKIWKWSLLVMAIVSGPLITKCILRVVVFAVERNFLLKNKVLYVIYGVRKSFQVFIYLGLVLLAWGLLITRGVKRSEDTAKILNYVTRALASLLIGAIVWTVKTVAVKLLASSFHIRRFFDRIQESIFHQYILQTLSGPPLMEIAEMFGTGSKPELSMGSTKTVLDVAALHKMNQEKVSARTFKGLINVITNSGLSTFSNTIAGFGDEEAEQNDMEITNEWDAKAAAMRIFRNVAKPGSKYIDEEDLLRFLSKSEVDVVLPVFVGAAEIGKIKKSAMRDWVVMVYHERKSLAHSLNDTKAATKQLNSIITAIMIVAIFISWLLIMGFPAIQVFVSISSLMLVVAFMFGNTAKTTFESILFVFVRHPFDVGDRCVIEGVQMVVEEIKLLKTVFLRYDNEKIDYPNSLLAAKPISNFNRSPDMGDTLDFCIDVSTSVESIGALKTRIKMYIESNPIHWNYRHLVEVKGIEDLNKMKMTLYVNHTMNYQNFWVRCNRRSELVLEMKKIFEDLSIKYHLLPQEVHLNNVGQQLQH